MRTATRKDNKEYLRLLEQVGTAQTEVSDKNYGSHDIRHDNAAEHRHDNVFKFSLCIVAEHDEHHKYDIDYRNDICRERQLLKELVFKSNGHKSGDNHVDYHQKLIFILRNVLYLVGRYKRHARQNYAQNRGKHKGKDRNSEKSG